MKTTDRDYFKEECKRLQAELRYRWQTDHPLALAARRENQKLYRKDGKRFVRVNDPYALDGLGEGFWLIKIEDGCTSIRQEIVPDKVAIHAAAISMEDDLITIIEEACEAKPVKLVLSDEEKKDWEWFIAKHGKSFSVLNYPSFQKTAEEIIKVLTGKATNKQ
jgi:hypothetical protein